MIYSYCFKIFCKNFCTSDLIIDFAKLFFATGYVPEHTQTVTLTTPQVTGAAIQTVVTGSGITGYELVCSSSISSRDGGTVEICSRSGVSGALTGKINVYLTGSGVNSYASGFSVAPEMFLDSGLFYGYNRNTIVFDENLDNLDTYEIYFYDQFKNNFYSFKISHKEDDTRIEVNFTNEKGTLNNEF